MKPTTTTMSLAACLSVAAVHAASAQLDTARSARSELAVAVGAELTQQRDATASPLRFDGSGYQLSARYGRTAGRLTLSATFDGGRRRLTSGAASGGVENLTDGELRVAVRRALTSGQAAEGLAAGVDLATSVGITSHHYADPTGSTSDFAFGAMTVGPAVSWRQAIAGGLAIAQLSVPVVGLVDHPYSDVRVSGSRIDARLATPSRLRGIAAAATYAPVMKRAVGVEFGYRLCVLHYADIQPMRSVSQAISVGIVRRFGTRVSPS